MAYNKFYIVKFFNSFKYLLPLLQQDKKEKEAEQDYLKNTQTWLHNASRDNSNDLTDISFSSLIFEK